MLILLLAAQAARAQSIYQDVIYLKNGGVVRGEIMRIENGVLHIRTNGESITEIPMTDVKRLTKQPRTSVDTDSIKQRVFKSEGVAVFQEIGYGYSTGLLRTSRGSFNYQSRSYTFLAGVGVYMADYVLLGIGTGYGQLAPDRRIIPIFGEVRTHFSRKQFSPYLLMRGGYAVGWRDNISGNDWGGAMFEAAAGIKTFLTPRHAIYAQVGYQQQQQRIELINLFTQTIFSERANYQFWGLRAGILF
ncbi:hypothetical protein [Rhodoflexus sp.]